MLLLRHADVRVLLLAVLQVALLLEILLLLLQEVLVKTTRLRPDVGP